MPKEHRVTLSHQTYRRNSFIHSEISSALFPVHLVLFWVFLLVLPHHTILLWTAAADTTTATEYDVSATGSTNSNITERQLNDTLTLLRNLTSPPAYWMPYKGSPGHFFPPNYGPMPPQDCFLPDPSDDWPEMIFYWEHTRETLVHSPFVFSIALEVMGDLRPSNFAYSSVYVNEDEREALRAARRTAEWQQRMRGLPQPVVSTSAAPTLPPTEALVEETTAQHQPVVETTTNILSSESTLTIENSSISNSSHGGDGNSSTPQSSGVHFTSMNAASTIQDSSTRNASTAFSLSETQISLDLKEVHVEDVNPDNNLSPDDILFTMIQGDYVSNDALPPMMDVLDRYFVHHMELPSITNGFCDHFIELLHLPQRDPLVLTMHSWMVSRFAYRCLFLRSHALLTAQRKFVLVSPEGDNAVANSFYLTEVLFVPNFNITYFLRHPLLVHWYGVNGQVKHPKFTPTPIGRKPFRNDMTSLAQYNPPDIDLMKYSSFYVSLYMKGLDLNKVFPHIPHKLKLGRQGTTLLKRALELFAGKTEDPPVEWIPLEQLPERVTTIYVVEVPAEKRKREGRPSLFHEVLIIHNEPGNRAAAAAQHVALLPFTAALYHKLQQHPYGDPKKENMIVAAYHVWDFRIDLDRYLHSPKLIPHVYTVTSIFHNEFASLLNDYVFVMSPRGYGYDCYRTWEALSFGAIPIIEDPKSIWPDPEPFPDLDSSAMADLFQDLPVVIVQNYTDISPENITKWRQDVYDKFRRGEYKLEKMFTQYWYDLFSSHTNEE